MRDVFIINPAAGKEDCTKELTAEIREIYGDDCKILVTMELDDYMKIYKEIVVGHDKEYLSKYCFPQEHFTIQDEFEFDILKARLREMAFLTKGLRIILRDKRGADAKIVDTAAKETQLNELLERANEDALAEAVPTCEAEKAVILKHLIEAFQDV